MRKRSNRLTSTYSAYYRAEATQEDAYLTHVGRGTPCGEYLRRFWHPVELDSEVGDFPVAVRILGEDLILFRDMSGNLGLLERACRHRSTSLEFGRICDHGIQCAYHGWHFDVDGTILNAPTEAADSKIKSRMFQGAYPVQEHMGLIFAYMGPPEERPALPIFDHYLRPGKRCVCYKEPSPCNWLQVRENEMDPMHIVFLHTRIAGVQFSEVYGEIPEVDFVETPMGASAIATRRYKDFVYTRTNDMVLPNISRVPAIDDAEGETICDVRAGFTGWVVPVDDTNTLSFGWSEFEEELPHPERDALIDRRARAGHDQQDFFVGQSGAPSYQQRQRAPGDWDCWTSQGLIVVHGRENLGASDRGVAMWRRLIREGIKAVEKGADPKGVVREPSVVVPTYAHNTVKQVPRAATVEEDRKLLSEFGRDITDKVMSGEVRPTYTSGQNE